MKKLMGIESNDNSNIQGLANTTVGGNCGLLANNMNDFFVSVSDHLPRLQIDNEVFDVKGVLPDELISKLYGVINIPTSVPKRYCDVVYSAFRKQVIASTSSSNSA